MWCHQKGSVRASVLPAASVQEGEDALLIRAGRVSVSPFFWIKSHPLEDQRRKGGNPLLPTTTRQKQGRLKQLKIDFEDPSS